MTEAVGELGVEVWVKMGDRNLMCMSLLEHMDWQLGVGRMRVLRVEQKMSLKVNDKLTRWMAILVLRKGQHYLKMKQHRQMGGNSGLGGLHR